MNARAEGRKINSKTSPIRVKLISAINQPNQVKVSWLLVPNVTGRLLRAPWNSMSFLVESIHDDDQRQKEKILVLSISRWTFKAFFCRIFGLDLTRGVTRSLASLFVLAARVNQRVLSFVNQFEVCLSCCKWAMQSVDKVRPIRQEIPGICQKKLNVTYEIFSFQLTFNRLRWTWKIQAKRRIHDRCSGGICFESLYLLIYKL